MDCTASRGPVARETLAKHGRARCGLAEGTQVLGQAGRSHLLPGVTGQSCPSPGQGPSTAAHQAQPALPRPCRPPLIGVISHRYFPRSQQRFDNKQDGQGKGFNCCEPHPQRSPGSGPDTEHKAGFARGGAEASGGRRTLAAELCAGRARRLFREHLGMTQCLLLSMRVMSMPRSRRFALIRGRGPAAPRARQNLTGSVQNPASLPPPQVGISGAASQGIPAAPHCFTGHGGIQLKGDFFSTLNESKNSFPWETSLQTDGAVPTKLMLSMPSGAGPEVKLSIPQGLCLPPGPRCPSPCTGQVGKKGLTPQLPARRCGVMLKLFPLLHEVSCH